MDDESICKVRFAALYVLFILQCMHCIPFTHDHAETKINCKSTKNVNFEDKHTFTQWY